MIDHTNNKDMIFGRYYRFVLCFSLVLFGLIVADTALAETVIKVVDGDTVILSNNKVVRLIGVDTPELHESAKLYRNAYHHKKDVSIVMEQGKKAASFVEKMLLNKEVELKYDRKRKDVHKRTLGYLFLVDGTLVNKEIILQGYSTAYTKFPFKYKKDFKKAEKEARQAKRGLWAEGEIL